MHNIAKLVCINMRINLQCCSEKTIYIAKRKFRNIRDLHSALLEFFNLEFQNKNVSKKLYPVILKLPLQSFSLLFI